MRTCLSVLVLLPAFGASSLCQALESHDAHDCERAADRLRAQSQREKSWGAHLAMICQLTGLAGDIEAELTQAGPEALANSLGTPNFFDGALHVGRIDSITSTGSGGAA